MDFNQIWPLVFELYIIDAIAQIVFIIIFTKELKSKPWSTFIGLIVGTYIFALLSYIILGANAVDLGTAILTIFLAGGIAIINSIILTIGLIIRAVKKKKINPAEHSLHKPTFFLSAGVFLLASLGIITIIPTAVQQTTNINNEQIVINYLIKKYGNHQYTIAKVDSSYGHNGMWDKSLDGYVYSIRSDITNDVFYVHINQDGTIRTDYLLEVYYSEQTNVEVSCSIDSVYGYPHCSTSDLAIYFDNRLIEEYSLQNPKLGDHYFTTSIVPDDGGRIPSTDEMLQMLADHYSNKVKTPEE